MPFANLWCHLTFPSIPRRTFADALKHPLAVVAWIIPWNKLKSNLCESNAAWYECYTCWPLFVNRITFQQCWSWCDIGAGAYEAQSENHASRFMRYLWNAFFSVPKNVACLVEMHDLVLGYYALCLFIAGVKVPSKTAIKFQFHGFKLSKRW